jgi:hypothetical protein
MYIVYIYSNGGSICFIFALFCVCKKYILRSDEGETIGSVQDLKSLK